jgi:predicted metal-dependent enzyme (double-stranded beta helix superfamily)
VTTIATRPCSDAFTPLSTLDWNDLPAVNSAATALLGQLAANRTILADLTAQMVENPHLAALCEHYDILDKLVLHDDPSGWRLRLHVFLDGYFDRPHNHRWTYTSRILTGSYTHTLYGTDHEFTDEVDVSALTPRLVRVEEPGDTYTLHHSMIHSVTAHGEAITLIVRGPAVKDRFVVTDRATGKAWWQYGAATETTDAAAAKRMSDTQLRGRIAMLRASGIFGTP